MVRIVWILFLSCLFVPGVSAGLAVADVSADDLQPRMVVHSSNGVQDAALEHVRDQAPTSAEVHDAIIVSWWGIKQELMHPPDDPEEIAKKVNDPSWLFTDPEWMTRNAQTTGPISTGSATAPATFGAADKDASDGVYAEAGGDAGDGPRMKFFTPEGGPEAQGAVPPALHEAVAPTTPMPALLAAAPYLAAVPLLFVAWRFARLAALGLFTRFHGDKALQNPQRNRVVETVTSRPGINVKALAEEVGLSVSTTVHHLRILEQTGHLETRRHGRTRHVFSVGHGRQEKQATMVLHHEKARSILDYVMHNPGAIQGQVADGVGVGQSLAHWHLKRLESAGLVRARRVGRSRIYLPGSTAAL